MIYDGDQKRYAKIAGHGFRILAEAMETNLPYRINCPAQLICGEKDHAGSTHILDDNTSDFSFFNVGSQPLPIRSVKVSTAISIVGIVCKVRKPLFFGILFKHFLLVYNAVAVPIQFIHRCPVTEVLLPRKGDFMKRPDNNKITALYERLRFSYDSSYLIYQFFY